MLQPWGWAAGVDGWRPYPRRAHVLARALHMLRPPRRSTAYIRRTTLRPPPECLRARPNHRSTLAAENGTTTSPVQRRLRQPTGRRTTAASDNADWVAGYPLKGILPDTFSQKRQRKLLKRHQVAEIFLADRFLLTVSYSTLWPLFLHTLTESALHISV